MTYNPSQARVPAGSPGGGRFGGGNTASSNAPRNTAAAKAQQNPKARPLFDKLMGLSPAERAKFAKGLSDGDLELLTQVVYSVRTSNPEIVKARVAVANEMTKRGIDIKKYGALGGGLTSKNAPAKKVTPAQARAVAHVQARKVAAKPAPKAAAKPAPMPAQAVSRKMG